MSAQRLEHDRQPGHGAGHAGPGGGHVLGGQVVEPDGQGGSAAVAGPAAAGADHLPPRGPGAQGQLRRHEMGADPGRRRGRRGRPRGRVDGAGHPGRLPGRRAAQRGQRHRGAARLAFLPGLAPRPASMRRWRSSSGRTGTCTFRVGDVGFWQGAFRDTERPQVRRGAEGHRGPRAVDGGTAVRRPRGRAAGRSRRFTMLPARVPARQSTDPDASCQTRTPVRDAGTAAPELGWMATASRHWNIDRPEPEMTPAALLTGNPQLGQGGF